MTREVFTNMLALLEETFGVEFSESRQQVWWTLIGELDDDEVMRATILCCRESQYPPKPADIWNRVRPPIDAAERNRLLEFEADRALAHLEAWINDMAADYGPVLNAVVRSLGGLQAVVDLMIGPLGNGEDAEWRYRRGEAKRLYMAFRTSGVPAGLAYPVSTTRWAEQMESFPAWRYEERGLPVPHPVVAVFEVPVPIPGLPAPVHRRQLPKGDAN